MTGHVFISSAQHMHIIGLPAYSCTYVCMQTPWDVNTHLATHLVSLERGSYPS